MNYSKISNVEVDGIDYADAPDFCDAYISSADYNGRQMTDAELEELSDDGDFIHDAIHNQLY